MATNKKKGRKSANGGSGKHVAFSDGTKPGYQATATATTTTAANATANANASVNGALDGTTSQKVLRRQQLASVPAKPGQLTRGQLNSVILISIGVSRILQLFNAISRSTTKDDDAAAAAAGAIEPSETCLKYLGAEACGDSHLQILLRFKFAAALQCAILVFSFFILICWKLEIHLQRLQAFLILSPLAPTFFVLYHSDLHGRSQIVDTEGNTVTQYKPVILSGLFQECIMCVVLTALVAPYDDTIFIRDFTNLNTAAHRRPPNNRRKTLQSLCLMTLYMLNLVEVVRHVGPFFQAAYEKTMTDTTWTTTLLQFYFDNVGELVSSETTTAAVAASSLVVQFILVDYLCQAIVFAYAWYAMEESNQRTILFFAAALQLFEYFYTIPTLQAASMASVSSPPLLRSDLLEAKRMVTLTMGCFAAFGWMAPSLTWKKSLAPTKQS